MAASKQTSTYKYTHTCATSVGLASNKTALISKHALISETRLTVCENGTVCWIFLHIVLPVVLLLSKNFN